MPPTLILIRHAEAQHAKKLQEHLRKHCPLSSRVEHIITSPLKRTCQTTLIGLDWLIKSGVPVEVDALWQENSDKPCDTGSDLKTIPAEFPQLDFSKVDPAFPTKDFDSPYAFRKSTNIARGATCLRKLYDRPEKVIAVVSHAGFLRTAISRRRFANADYRIFTFSRDEKNELELVEDVETEPNRGAMGRSEPGLFRIESWDFPPENVGDV